MYAIYNNIYCFSYDGTEIRFLKEVTRNWKVKIYDRQFLAETGYTYTQVCDDVQFKTTDTGTCSMWITSDTFKRMELSNYFGNLCGTFLVPKPHRITHASYMYLPLSSTVWWVLISFLIGTTLLHYLFLRIWTKNSRRNRYEIFGRTFLDAINILTSHGIPKIFARISIRILITSWLMLSLLLGAAYSTKYTSLLTLPMYTKAVDNLKDFLDAGLFWGEVGERDAWMEEFLVSSDPLHRELPKRIVVEKDFSERLKYIPEGRYARYVKV